MESENRRDQNPLIPEALVLNEACMFTPDKVYAIFPVSVGFVGVRVAGQITKFDKNMDPDDPWAFARQDWVARYKNANLDDIDGLKEIDKRNFRIGSDDVVSATMKTRRTLWTGPVKNSGTLKFRLRGGKKRNFILLGKQDHDTVLGFFAKIGVNVAH